MKKELFSMLALLMTAVPGAWADETPLLTIESINYTSFTSGSKPFDDKVTITFSVEVDNDGDTDGWYTDGGSLLTVAGTNGYTITSCKFYTAYEGIAKTGYTVEGESPSVYLYGMKVYTDDSKSVSIGAFGVTKIEVYGAAPSAADAAATPVDGFAWNTETNTGTFTMPAYDVELEVTYYTDSELTDMAIDAIDALPEPYQVTVSHKAAIETARAYYEALSDKTGFPAASLAKLVADEVALAIAELPAPNAVTANDRPVIVAARSAYDALSAAQKTDVGNAAVAKLEADEVALAIADLPLPTSVTIANKDAIIEARSAYDELSDDQKTAVGATALAKLVDAEKALCFKVNVPAGGYVTFITDQPLCAYNGTSPVAVLYTVSNVEGTTVTLGNAIDIASVNTPLLIYNTSSAAATLYLMPCNAPAASTTSFAGYKGTAVYKAQGADGNGPWNFAANTKYYGFDGQNFVRIVAAGSVAANRCWIELVGNSGARQLTIVRGDATGVSEEFFAEQSGKAERRVKSEESATAVWYDLQGRKVQGKPARKGMYLQNGQKIIIK